MSQGPVHFLSRIPLINPPVFPNFKQNSNKTIVPADQLVIQYLWRGGNRPSNNSFKLTKNSLVISDRSFPAAKF
jgi:hypothetical protein